MKYKIIQSGQVINTIVSDADFVESYCKENGFTYELIAEEKPEPTPAPTQLDRIEAQITYTAMMTDTLIPEVTA